MKIYVKTKARGDYSERTAEVGTRIEVIARELAEECPYQILLAKLNNRYVPLTHQLKEDEAECKIELLDMRTQAANLVYQSSLSLICIVAIRKFLPNARIEIENSLNQGLFMAIRNKEHLNTELAEQIQAEMRRIVDADLPIELAELTKEEALAAIEAENRSAKILELEDYPKETLRCYSLEGYYDYFHSQMVPSTGYIQYFTFEAYRRGALLRFPLPKKPDEIPPFEDQKKLYQAFGEQTLWDELLGIEYVTDLNNKIKDGSYKDLILMEEALHEKKIVEIANEIKHQKKRIVLIAGPSSSGKTTFAKRLCIQLKVNGLDTLYMGTDDYFVERDQTPMDENGEPDYEGLDAIDIDLFNRNMNDLLAGKEVDLPTFDFMEGKKVYGKRLTSIQPNQLIVIEGIHGLNEKMTAQIPKDEKFKIYISPLTQLNIDEHTRIPTTDERMLRRMVRDYQFRGHAAEQTLAEWPKVRAGEDKNIFPYNGEADAFYNSYYDYEIAILKKYAQPLLEKISQDEPEYAEARRMLRMLRPFRVMEDDSAIANNSILREFLGGSIFVD